MGKRGVWSVEDFARVRGDVEYHLFDLGEAAVQDRDLIPQLFGELSGLIESGALVPLPTSHWPLSAATSAFRHMLSIPELWSPYLGRLKLQSRRCRSMSHKSL